MLENVYLYTKQKAASVNCEYSNQGDKENQSDLKECLRPDCSFTGYDWKKGWVGTSSGVDDKSRGPRVFFLSSLVWIGTDLASSLTGV